LQIVLRNLSLRLPQETIIAAVEVRCIAIGALERTASLRLEKDSVYDVQDIVAGGSRHGPGAQLFARFKDFLDENIKARTDLSLKGANITLGISQTVDVVDPKSVDPLLVRETEQQFMGALEDLGNLYPKTGKAVDVEEATVIDVAGRDPPISQAVDLFLQQTMKHAETLRDSRGAADHLDGLIDRTLHSGRRTGEFRQLRLQLICCDNAMARGVPAQNPKLRAEPSQLL
jgi:hypothetical protein